MWAANGWDWRGPACGLDAGAAQICVRHAPPAPARIRWKFLAVYMVLRLLSRVYRLSQTQARSKLSIVRSLPRRCRANSPAAALSRRWLHCEVPEVSDCAWFEPQRDAAMSAGPRFDVFDNQRRLFIIVDVEARLFAAHLDFDLRPCSRHKVDVRFVLARRLLPKPGPGPLRKRDVLSGMIPALLIVGAAVRGA